ncbi:hypothetical protein Pcinc_031827 [Petrolisthes cinctipes]|uniref:Uncharacterized protein n=1 Tax=Petrolisthes cinctipes TaxID=88211 RepID=A0AAE1K2G4_PETCI|nr:hypothetical protein Pcinc_031827 [Petrolisthes cinctipes]
MFPKSGVGSNWLGEEKRAAGNRLRGIVLERSKFPPSIYGSTTKALSAAVTYLTRGYKQYKLSNKTTFQPCSRGNRS